MSLGNGSLLFFMRKIVRQLKNDLYTYGPYCIEEAGARLRAEVATTRLNWFWWILSPLLQMAVYIVIFGYIFHASTQYYPAHIFIGLTAWRFFSATLTSSAKIIRSNSSLLLRVYIPRFALILTQMLCNGFKMLVSFGIVLVLLLLYRIHPSVYFLQVVPLLLLLWLFTFGLSAITAHIGVYLSDVNDLLPILLRLWMYFTGIFYSIQDKIPGALGYWLLRLNPLAFILNGLRQSLLFRDAIMWSWLFFWLGVSFILCIAGARILYRYGTRYLKVG